MMEEEMTEQELEAELMRQLDAISVDGDSDEDQDSSSNASPGPSPKEGIASSSPVDFQSNSLWKEFMQASQSRQESICEYETNLMHLTADNANKENEFSLTLSNKQDVELFAKVMQQSNKIDDVDIAVAVEENDDKHQSTKTIDDVADGENSNVEEKPTNITERTSSETAESFAENLPSEQESIATSVSNNTSDSSSNSKLESQPSPRPSTDAVPTDVDPTNPSQELSASSVDAADEVRKKKEIAKKYTDYLHSVANGELSEQEQKYNLEQQERRNQEEQLFQQLEARRLERENEMKLHLEQLQLEQQQRQQLLDEQQRRKEEQLRRRQRETERAIELKRQEEEAERLAKMQEMEQLRIQLEQEEQLRMQEELEEERKHEERLRRIKQQHAERRAAITIQCSARRFLACGVAHRLLTEKKKLTAAQRIQAVTRGFKAKLVALKLKLQQKKAIEDAKLKAIEAARVKAEQARLRAVEAARAKAIEVARAKAMEAARLKAEEARLKAEEEARIKAEEARIKAEEARIKAEEEARIKAEEEARIKAEEEARIKAEEARIKAEEEARIKAEEEARIKAEEEARIKAEEEARIKAEEEARIKAEEARIKAEEEARIKAEEEARIKVIEGITSRIAAKLQHHDHQQQQQLQQQQQQRQRQPVDSSLLHAYFDNHGEVTTALTAQAPTLELSHWPAAERTSLAHDVRLRGREVAVFDARLLTRHPLAVHLDLSMNLLHSFTLERRAHLLLTRLDLSENQLTVFRLPECFLPSLDTLLLGGNKLAQLPALRAICPSLRHVDLSRNCVDSLAVMDAFRGCGSVELLSLAGNAVARLRGYYVAVLAQLPRLKELDGRAVSRRSVVAAAPTASECSLQSCLQRLLCIRLAQQVRFIEANCHDAHERRGQLHRLALRHYHQQLEHCVVHQLLGQTPGERWYFSYPFPDYSLEAARQRQRLVAAAVAVQSSFRGYRGRQQVLQQLVQSSCAVRIQAVVRGVLARLRLRSVLDNAKYVDDDEFAYDEIDIDNFLDCDIDPDDLAVSEPEPQAEAEPVVVARGPEDEPPVQPPVRVRAAVDLDLTKLVASATLESATKAWASASGSVGDASPLDDRDEDNKVDSTKHHQCLTGRSALSVHSDVATARLEREEREALKVAAEWGFNNPNTAKSLLKRKAKMRNSKSSNRRKKLRDPKARYNHLMHKVSHVTDNQHQQSHSANSSPVVNRHHTTSYHTFNNHHNDTNRKLNKLLHNNIMMGDGLNRKAKPASSGRSYVEANKSHSLSRLPTQQQQHRSNILRQATIFPPI